MCVNHLSNQMTFCVCLSLLSHHQPAAHWGAGGGHVWSQVGNSVQKQHVDVLFFNTCKIFVLHIFCVCVCSKGNSILEVDDEGGRMFLRVLIHLTMHDYPPLVSGALQLLFRHFSQRQEVLQTFKQVHTHRCTELKVSGGKLVLTSEKIP